MTAQQGGLAMIALAAILAYLLWAGVLTNGIAATANLFTTPRPRRAEGIPGLPGTATGAPLGAPFILA